MNKNIDAPRSQTILSETLIKAMHGASEEISSRETWIPRSKSVATKVVPRLMSLVMVSVSGLEHDGPARARVRALVIRTLAYLESDMRLAVIVDLSRRAPAVIDDLFSGSIPQDYEVYRFNLFSTLGIFARHGLMQEVFTEDRMKAVRSAMEKSSKPVENRGEKK